MTKQFLAVAISALFLTALSAPAFADTASDDSGPPQDVFENNDNAWFCGDDGFIDDHCLNSNSGGDTGNIMVFDGRGPQESISYNPNADSRPCPHDQGTDNEGTWWAPFPGAGFFVCHHNGNNN